MSFRLLAIAHVATAEIPPAKAYGQYSGTQEFAKYADTHTKEMPIQK